MTTSTLLPPPSYRNVRVAGVEIEMYEDTKPSRISPMRVCLRHWLEAEDITPEEFTRLHLAGIETLPAYETELLAAGIKYEEVG